MLRAFAIHVFAKISAKRYKMNPSCLFCKIASGEAPASILYQDDLVIAFRDTHPVAPTHVLIAPKKHIQSLSQAEAEDEHILGRLFTTVRKIAEMENIADNGYRTIINTGVEGGQTVMHLHLHVLGGQRMRYPIG